MSVLELLISFPFASVFLLQARLICWRRRRWGRRRREEKEKKFAKNKVCAGERWESAVEGTAGSRGVTAGASDPNASAGSSSRHTHSPTPLCSRLEFLSLALLLAALHASAEPFCQSKELHPSGSPGRGEGVVPRAWPRSRLRARPGSSDLECSAQVPPPHPAPQVSGCASPPLLLLPRLAGAEKLPTCVASPPPPLPRLQLSLAARWGGGREGGGD